MREIEYDAKLLGAELKRKLKHMDLKTLTKDEVYFLGLEVLKVSPKDRCDKGLECLRMMTATNKFFLDQKEKYGEYTYNQMIRSIYLEYVPEGEVLFEYQSIGYEFFIILKGMVGICINLKGPDYDERKKAASEGQLPVLVPAVPRHKSRFEEVPKSPSNVMSKVVKNASGYSIFYGETLMKEINSLPEGTSFGEVAIQGKDTCTRNATIYCKRDCYFAVLDKVNFQRIIGEHTARDNAAKVALLKKSLVYSCLPDKSLKTLIYFMTTKKYQFRDKIIGQGQEMVDIMLVKSGKVKLVREMGLQRESFLNLGCLKESVKNPHKQLLQIALLGEGEIIGEEFIRSKERVTFSAVCDSEEAEM